MGKSLRDLLEDSSKGVPLENPFKYPEFDPNKVKPDMLSSKEVGLTTGTINIPAIGLSIDGISLPYDRQYQKLAENVINIYGADSVRILGRGAVDPLQLAKRTIDRVSRSALALSLGNNTGVGRFVRNALNSFTVPQFPSDEVNDYPGVLPFTKNDLYGSLYRGGVNNNKNALANALSSFLTPKQFTQNIGSIDSGGKVKIGGASVDMAVNAGFNAFQAFSKKLGLNANRGAGSSAVSSIKNPLNKDNSNTPYYPSDYARLSFGKSSGTLTGIATGQNQLMRDGERFYTKYEGLNADKELKTIKLDGTKLSSKYLSEKSSLYDLIRPNVLFNGYLTYDDGYATSGISFEEGTRYKFFDIENATKEDLREKKFSVNVYTEKGKGESDLYNGKNAINTKLFAGVTRRKNAAAEGDTLEEVAVVSSKRHTTLSSLALNGSDATQSDLISIYLRDRNSNNFIMLMSNLTGLTDTPTPTWGDAKPIGSPYKFYYYQSFEREISFKGQLYARNENQLNQLWKKVESLQRLTMASSGGWSGIKGKICELKIGDFVESKYGFLTNCTITVPDESPWEIQKDSQVPFVCEFDITYQVIQTNSDFNTIAVNNVPTYDYISDTLPGLDFSKNLNKGNNDIKKIKYGWNDLLGIGGTMEAGREGNINSDSFAGMGETSTSEIPTILEPQKWQITGTGEAPIGSGLLESSGTDTTSTLEPFDESVNKQTQTPKPTGGITQGRPLFPGGPQTDWFTPIELMITQPK